MSEPESSADPDAMPMRKVGRGENAKEVADWQAAGVNRGHKYLFDEKGLSREDARKILAANIKEAEKNLNKHLKKEPDADKYTDPDKFIRDREKHSEKTQQLQQTLDYWKQMQAIEDQMEADLQRKLEERGIGRPEPTDQEMLEMYGADEATYQEMTENDPYTIVANEIGGKYRRLTPESIRQWTGMSGKEIRMPGVVAKAENGGLTIEHCAELICADYPILAGKDMEVRDMIIDILLSGGNPRSVTKQRREGMIAQARRQYEEEQALYQHEIEEATHMSYDEWEAYEESTYRDIAEKHQHFDESEYNAKLADEYEKRQRYEREQQQSADSAAVGTADGRGGDILQEPQPTEAGRVAESGQGHQGAEAGAGGTLHTASADVPTDRSPEVPAGSRQRVQEAHVGIPESSYETQQTDKDQRRGNRPAGFESNEHSVGIPRRTVELLDMVARQLNTRVRFGSAEECNGHQGLYRSSTGEIIINREALPGDTATGHGVETKALHTIFGHEVGHAIKEASADHPEIWEAYRDCVREYLGEDGWEEFMAEKREAYREAYNYDPADQEQAEKYERLIEEEVCVQFGGEMIARDPERFAAFVDRVAKSADKPATVLRRVLDFLAKMRDSLRQILRTGRAGGSPAGSNEALENAYRTFEGMYEYVAAKVREAETLDANPDIDRASISGNKKSQPNARQDLTTSSSQKVDDAKLQTISDNLSDLQKKFVGKRDKKGVLTDLSYALNAKESNDGPSRYATFVLPNGKTAEIRISNHNANAQTFADHGHTEGNISIVIKSRRTGNRFQAHPEVELTEYVYTTEAISKDAEMLSKIAQSLQWLIKTGEYKDLTGKAIINNSPYDLIDIAKEGANFHQEKQDLAHEAARDGEDIKYSVRTKAEPMIKKEGYKLFRVDREGNPYALFIDANHPLERGVWLDADSPNIVDLLKLDEGHYLIDKDGNATAIARKPSKKMVIDAAARADGSRYMLVGHYADGSKRVANYGINGSGGVGEFAMRPGWHLTNAPSARHIGAVGEDGKTKTYRRPDERWFKVEFAADKDYNEEAAASTSKAKGIDSHIPEDGWYEFQTNSNANPNQSWIITGAIRILEPVPETEAHRISKGMGIEEDLPYRDGIKHFSEEGDRFSIMGEKGASMLDRAQETRHRMDNLDVARRMEEQFKELEGTEQHKKMVEAANKVRELEPIKVAKTPKDKAEAINLYKEIGTAKNKQTGAEVQFFNSAFKKDHKEGGLFEKSIPALKEAFEDSVLAYSQEDNLGGTTRKDGTVHKTHNNIISFDNYIGKIQIEGKDCYVRYTVQVERNRLGAHSMFVSNVDIYENPTESRTIPLTLRGTTDFSGIIDAKLQQFFVLASSNPKENAARIRLATGWERGADGKWRYEVPDGKFADNVLQDFEEGRDFWTLDEIWHDDNLYEAYPELRNYEVVVDPDYMYEQDADGQLNTDNKRITLSDSVFIYNQPDVLLHEIQHAIQDIEGFAQGGNTKYGQDRYHKLAGEVEARNVQTRMDYTDEQRRNTLLQDTEDVARDLQILLDRNDGNSLSLGDSHDTFEQRQKEAVKNHGTVMPGLNEAVVNVVEVPRHSYKGSGLDVLKQAVDAAIKRYEGQTIHYDNHGAKFDYVISNRSLKYAANHSSKSDNIGIHAAIMDKLDTVIGESIEVMEHPDVHKVDGTRIEENGYNENSLIHRFVGAANIGGKTYRVITTLKEYAIDKIPAHHTYEVTKIEVPDVDTPSTSNVTTIESNSPIGMAKLLKGVEIHNKSGKKILEESAKASTSTNDINDRNSIDATDRQGKSVIDIANDIAERYSTKSSDKPMIADVEKISNFAAEDVAKRLDKAFWEGASEKDRVGMVEYLQQTQEGKDVIDRLYRHRGTPWSKAASNSALVRIALEDVIQGREPSVASMLAGHKIVQRIQRQGTEGIWGYLMDKKIIGNAAKCVNNVNGSYTSCRPSDNCAEFCYASKGNSASTNSIVKNELVNWAVRTDPKRVAEMIARQYAAKYEFYNDKALRLFEAGDLDEAWLPVIEELNRRGIVTQIFSKNPEVLQQVDRTKNVVMLSVDASNLHLLEQYPDVPVAFVYASPEDLPALQQCRDRFEKYGGSILPVVEGKNTLSKEDLSALPQWTHRFQCPVDNGTRKINNKERPDLSWNCTKCDSKGGVGCFYHRTTQTIKEVVNEYIRRDDIATAAAKMRRGAEAGNAEGILGGIPTLPHTDNSRGDSDFRRRILRTLREGGVPDANITTELLEALDSICRERVAGRGMQNNTREVSGDSPVATATAGRGQSEGLRPERGGGIEGDNRYSIGNDRPMIEEQRYTKHTVEKGFGGLWIADKEEFAKFASATINNHTELDGEGMCYTANHFYAYYRNNEGAAIPFIQINLNQPDSQKLVNYVQRRRTRGENIATALDGSANRFRPVRPSGGDNSGNINNSEGVSDVLARALDSATIRRGKYADLPGNYVKALEPLRPGDDRDRRIDPNDRYSIGSSDKPMISPEDLPLRPDYEGYSIEEVKRLRQAKYRLLDNNQKCAVAQDIVKDILDNINSGGIGHAIIDSADSESISNRLEGLGYNKQEVEELADYIKHSNANGLYEPIKDNIIIFADRHSKRKDIVRTYLHERGHSIIENYGLHDKVTALADFYQSVWPIEIAEFKDRYLKLGEEESVLPEEIVVDLNAALAVGDISMQDIVPEGSALELQNYIQSKLSNWKYVRSIERVPAGERGRDTRDNGAAVLESGGSREGIHAPELSQPRENALWNLRPAQMETSETRPGSQEGQYNEITPINPAEKYSVAGNDRPMISPENINREEYAIIRDQLLRKFANKKALAEVVYTANNGYLCDYHGEGEFTVRHGWKIETRQEFRGNDDFRTKETFDKLSEDSSTQTGGANLLYNSRSGESTSDAPMGKESLQGEPNRGGDAQSSGGYSGGQFIKTGFDGTKAPRYQHLDPNEKYSVAGSGKPMLSEMSYPQRRERAKREANTLLDSLIPIKHLNEDNKLHARNAVANFIKTALEAERMPLLKKAELNSILARVKRVDTARQLQAYLLDAQRIVTDIDTRHQLNRISRMLRQPLQQKDKRGQAAAKGVDDETRRAMLHIRQAVREMQSSTHDQEIHIINQQLYRLRRDRSIAQLTGDTEWLEQINAEYQDRVDALTQAKQELEAKREEELADKTNQLHTDWKARLQELEAKQKQGTNSDGDSASPFHGEEEGLTPDEAIELQALHILNSIAQARNLETYRVTDANNKVQSESIKSARLQHQRLTEQRKQAHAAWLAESDPDRKAELKQVVRAIDSELHANRLLEESLRQTQNDIYRRAADDMSELLEGGAVRLREELQADAEHDKQITQNALDDINRGKRWEQRGRNGKRKDIEKRSKTSKFFHGLFGAALDSFDYMTKSLSKAMAGNGFLYQHFMLGDRGFMAAYDDMLLRQQEAKQMLDEAASRFLGKKKDAFTHYSVKYSKVESNSGVTRVSVDKKTGESRRDEQAMSRGTAMYIYQLWNMTDGQMKLRKMGFDETSYNEVLQFIGPELKQLADWMVDEYYPKMRTELNKVYRELFHTTLPEIENYVPIRIDPLYISGDAGIDTGTAGSYSQAYEKRNGSLITRTVNVNPIDLSRTAFDVLAEHNATNTEWIAFARFRKDLNTVLSNRTFRNTLNANVRGRFHEFEEAARIAALLPVGDKIPGGEWAMGPISRGVVGGAIAYKSWTALKQTLSFPAFWGYSQSPKYMAMLHAYAFNFKGNYKWAKENMSTFAKRIEMGFAGSTDIEREIEALQDGLGKKVFTGYSKSGMWLNKQIDALTCAAGARAIYEYEMSLAKEKIKQGADPEAIKKMALRKAAAAFNSDQQSSVAAFTSTSQKSKAFWSRMSTTFQQANIGYTRMALNAFADMRKGIDNFDHQVEVRMKLYGEDEKTAKRRVRSDIRKGLWNLSLYGFGLKLLWDNSGKLATTAMALAVGIPLSQAISTIWQDDDEPEDEALKWLSRISYYGGTIMQGTPGGNFFHDGVGQYNPLSILVQSEISDIKYMFDKYGWSPELAGQVISGISDISGFKISTWSNICAGTSTLMEEGYSPDVAMRVMMVLNMPQSVRKDWIEMQSKDISVLEYADAMAYATRRRQGELGWWSLAGYMQQSDKKRQELYNEWFTLQLGKDQAKAWKAAQDKHDQLSARQNALYGSNGKYRWTDVSEADLNLHRVCALEKKIGELVHDELKNQSPDRHMVNDLMQLQVKLRRMGADINNFDYDKYNLIEQEVTPFLEEKKERKKQEQEAKKRQYLDNAG